MPAQELSQAKDALLSHEILTRCPAPTGVGGFKQLHIAYLHSLAGTLADVPKAKSAFICQQLSCDKTQAWLHSNQIGDPRIVRCAGHFELTLKQEIASPNEGNAG